MTRANIQLGYELRIACMRLVRRVRYNTDSLPPHFFSVLASLDRGPATAADLAAHERVSAPSMSRTIAELVERGDVERTPDPDDKRCLVLTLTPQGSEVLGRARTERDAWMDQRLKSVSADERKTLAEAAKIINKMLEDS